MKKVALIITLSIFLLKGYAIKAQTVPQDSKANAIQAQPQNVGNKICPVTGEKVGEGGMAGATYEYKGKIYNFCCSGCVEEFKKEPEKYIKKIEEELKTNAAQNVKIEKNASSAMPGGHAQ
jgi:YHS domain-containing protein